LQHIHARREEAELFAKGGHALVVARDMHQRDGRGGFLMRERGHAGEQQRVEALRHAGCNQRLLLRDERSDGPAHSGAGALAFVLRVGGVEHDVLREIASI
jgi:hypothetical protein